MEDSKNDKRIRSAQLRAVAKTKKMKNALSGQKPDSKSETAQYNAFLFQATGEAIDKCLGITQACAQDYL